MKGWKEGGAAHSIGEGGGKRRTLGVGCGGWGRCVGVGVGGVGREVAGGLGGVYQ